MPGVLAVGFIVGHRLGGHQKGVPGLQLEGAARHLQPALAAEDKVDHLVGAEPRPIVLAGGAGLLPGAVERQVRMGFENDAVPRLFILAHFFHGPALPEISLATV